MVGHGVTERTETPLMAFRPFPPRGAGGVLTKNVSVSSVSPWPLRDL
jgi:hypothetical protein